MDDFICLFSVDLKIEKKITQSKFERQPKINKINKSQFINAHFSIEQKYNENH